MEGIRDGVANTPEKLDKYLEVIYQKSIDMDQLIDDLFLFSKLDLSKLPFEMRDVEVTPFLNELVSEMKLGWENENNRINLNFNSEDLRFTIDQQQIKRVFVNVIQNSMKYIDKAEKNLSRHANKLGRLLDRCNDMSKPIYVYMDKSVLKSFWIFDEETTVDWKQKALSNPFHYNYQYKKRLSEMAIKQAGRYCIGRNIDYIIKNGFDGSIKITGEDMERGIARMKVSDKHLNDIFAQRMLAEKVRKLGPNALNNRQYTPQYVFRCLDKAPNKMATSGQWYALTGMSNINQFTEYKNKLLEKGLVHQVDKKSIKDKYEITRLETYKSAVKIYEVTRNKNAVHS